jgi:two-component system LytT family response regulator
MASVTVKTMIVDDEPLARRRLSRLLKDDPDIELIGSCASAGEALALASQQRPDLIFLDIQMPKMDGFAFLRSLDWAKIPHIVFVTAHDDYALKAFEVYALDYILKPFDQQRFEEALRRAKERIRSDREIDLGRRVLSAVEQFRLTSEHPASSTPIGKATPKAKSKSGNDSLVRPFLIKSNGRAFFVKPETIDWIQAEGKYSRINVGKASYLLREPIGDLETRLEQANFLRIHRSTLVNIDRVKEMHQWFNGRYTVVLHDGTRLTLSRRYRRRMEALLGAHS